MTAATPPAGSPPTGTATASYVYGVTRDLDPAALGTLSGIGGARVRVVATGATASSAAGLQVLVGDVDPDEFSAHAVAERREDLAWLGAIARAHHEVVATAGALAPVVPLALATVYLDDGRAADAVAERAPTFAAALDRVTGRSEWGVKAFARPRSTSARAPASSGRDYLRARRSALHASETAADDAARAGEELHADLGGRAIAARRHRPQDAALSGRDETMVLNGAYLVADGEDDALRAAVEAWSGDERITVELTGPWVPYSFTDPETGDGAP